MTADEQREIARLAALSGRWHEGWRTRYADERDGSNVESAFLDECLDDLFALLGEPPTIEALAGLMEGTIAWGGRGEFRIGERDLPFWQRGTRAIDRFRKRNR